jgi:predicted nucleotidyltransferase
VLDHAAILVRLPHVNELFERAPGIHAAYVFGSVLADDRESIRDVDFAVLARHPLSLAETGNLLLELERVLGTDQIDVVDLRTARGELRFEVLSQGRLLVERDADAHARFRERVLHDHLATRHRTQVYRSLLQQEFHRSYAHATR